jgi:hypothetical protein
MAGFLFARTGDGAGAGPRQSWIFMPALHLNRRPFHRD